MLDRSQVQIDYSPEHKSTLEFSEGLETFKQLIRGEAPYFGEAEVEPDPQLVDALKRLSAGQFEPDDWIKWWKDHADSIAEQLKRGPWLRLKPPEPGGFGPSCRCTLISQQEAFKLLDGWGIEHQQSDRYQQQWEVEFEIFTRKEKQKKAQKREQFRPRLDCLKVSFPKLARFLSRNLDQVEELGEPASDEQIEHLEQSLGAKLAASYSRFLTCTSVLVYSDWAQIGLPYTFRHPDAPDLPSAGRICFGEYWLESDGDQVVFDDADADREPAVLYYNHSEPSVRVLAEDFTAWLESLPRSLDV